MATNEQIKNFLLNPDKIAIIVASANPQKPGHFVPKLLISRGFTIISINPFVDNLFGNATLSNIDELTDKVKGVIIYRKQAIAEEIAIKSALMKIPMIWLPLGISSQKAKKVAKENNVLFVENKCPKKELEKILRSNNYKNK